MVEIRGLRKRFGKTQALDDFTFCAANGSITGLLGANGAGKTTCLRILAALSNLIAAASLLVGR